MRQIAAGILALIAVFLQATQALNLTAGNLVDVLHRQIGSMPGR